jgi:hypothetical protein
MWVCVVGGGQGSGREERRGKVQIGEGGQCAVRGGGGEGERHPALDQLHGFWQHGCRSLQGTPPGATATRKASAAALNERSSAPTVLQTPAPDPAPPTHLSAAQRAQHPAPARGLPVPSRCCVHPVQRQQRTSAGCCCCCPALRLQLLLVSSHTCCCCCCRASIPRPGGLQAVAAATEACATCCCRPTVIYCSQLHSLIAASAGRRCGLNGGRLIVVFGLISKCCWYSATGRQTPHNLSGVGKDPKTPSAGP